MMRLFGVLEVLSLGTLVSGKGVGDFVASGLGLAASASTPSTSSTAISTHLLATRPSTYLASGTTRPANSTGPTTRSSPYLTSTGTASHSLVTGGPYANVSVDECWSSWDEYWSWRHDKTEIHSEPAKTSVFTQIITFGGNASTGDTYTTTIDTTRTIDNGGFDITTQTIDTTSTSTNIYSAYPTSTFTSRDTYVSYSTYKEKPTNTVTRPHCKLPKEVSQCQNEWESWISTVLIKPTPTPPPGCDVGAGFMNFRSVPPCASSYSSAQGSYYTWSQSQSAKIPVCSQASIRGPLCESIRDDYVQMKANWFAPPGYATAFFFSAGYLGTFQNVTAGNMQPSYYWPTSQTLSPAPSCTVGCGRCAVTGGTVDLLYWPTHTATDGPAPTAPVTLETLGTTFTSPTLYISYSNVYASNGCSGVGSTITSTIVPIPTDLTLSSVYAGTIGCDAHFRMTQVWTATASFNVADLNSPVPYSIYSSQPWCQTYLRNQNCQGTCPTDAPYKPLVVVPQQVLQQLQPEWADCLGDIRGAYDPPKALQPVATAPGPTQPEPTENTTPTPAPHTPATPADGTGPTTPSPTNGPGPTTPSATDGEGPSPTADPEPQSDQNPALTDGGGDDPTQTTQNPGGIIASLLGPSGGDEVASPTTMTQNAGGIVASLLGGGNSATTAGGGNGPAGGPAQAGNSPPPAASDPQPGTVQPADGPTVAGGNSAPTDGQSAGHATTASPANPRTTAAGNTGDPAGPGAEPDRPSLNTIATIGSETVTLAPAPASEGSSAIQVAYGGTTTTLARGGIAIIGGNEVSAASDGNVVYGSGNQRQTVAVTSQSGESAPYTVATIGSESVTVAPASGSSLAAIISYDGTTMTMAPGSVTTIDGTQVSMASDGKLVYGTGHEQSTIAVPTQGGDDASYTVAVIGSESITVAAAPGSSSAAVIAFDGTTRTLAPGSIATIDGTQVSLARDGNLVYGSGRAESTLTVPGQGAVITDSGATATAANAGPSLTASGVSVPQATGNGAERLSGSLWNALWLSLGLMALYYSA